MTPEGVNRLVVGQRVTIAGPAAGETLEVQLEENEFHMLWLVKRNPRGSGRFQFLLSAALQTGWRIARRHPRSRALLETHGFGSRPVE